MRAEFAAGRVPHASVALGNRFARPPAARDLRSARTSSTLPLPARVRRPRECAIEALAERTARSGPASLLLRAFRSGMQVAVVTRHRKGVRGVCTGACVEGERVGLRAFGRPDLVCAPKGDEQCKRSCSPLFRHARGI